MSALCLVELTRRTSVMDLKRTFARSARQSYAGAVQGAEKFRYLYFGWGKFNLNDVLPLYSDPTLRQAVLEEARRVFEEGRKHVGLTAERVKYEQELAVCLSALALETPDLGLRKKRLDASIAYFESSTKVAPDQASSTIYERWGLALFRLGQLRSDHLLIRQAVAKLDTALNRDPRNNDARLYLASAYAVLQQTSPALRNLRICLGRDPDRVYLQRTVNSTDFDPLRRTRPFNELIQHHLRRAGGR
jgi:tetratricopeptide (TPR) repeat protein